MRRRPGSLRDSAAKGASDGAMMKGSPAVAPPSRSSASAESRTLRDTTRSLEAPSQTSPQAGPTDTRPRDGRKPNKPQHAAGIRIDPPPSLAPAIGTIPAATAAAEPPLDPPGVRSRSQGLRVNPNAADSVTALRPSSGVLVFPKINAPASQKRCTIVEWRVAAAWLNARLPLEVGSPA